MDLRKLLSTWFSAPIIEVDSRRCPECDARVDHTASECPECGCEVEPVDPDLIPHYWGPMH